jgi:peptidoglycan/xylan/chitin deacetylase (PgdA/CDA1 family)
VTLDWLVAVMALLAAYFLVPVGYLRVLRWQLARQCGRSGTVALTYDDGPGPHLSREVTARLEAAGARGSFFVLGRNLAAHAALVREIAARGHLVGSHGFAHVHHWWCAPWSTVADVRRGETALAAVLGVPPRGIPFRPPYGRLNLLTLTYLLLRRTPIVTWTIDSYDSWGSGKTPQRAAAEVRRRGSGVVLLHDFDRRDPSNAAFVLACTDLIIAEAHGRLRRVDRLRTAEP